MIKKVHINICPILDGYGVMTVFKFPYTSSCEPRLSAGGSLSLASYRQGVPVITTLGRYLWRAGKGGVLRATRAVHNRAAAFVAAGGGIFENQL